MERLDPVLRRATARVTIVVIAVIAVCGATLWHYWSLSEERRLYDDLLRTNHWSATQLEFELQRFLDSASRYAYRAPGVGPEEVGLRFEILLSRVPLMNESDGELAIRRIPGAVATLERLRAALAEVEPMIDWLEPGAVDVERAIRSTLDPLREPLHEIVVELFQGSRSKEVADTIRRGGVMSLLFLVGVTLAMLMLVVIFAFEAWRNVQIARRERAARREADMASRAKSRFFAAMSHELRTPLNAIIGFSDFMRSETLGPLGRPEYKDYAGEISAAGNRLIDVLSDVMDMARVDGDELEVDLDDVKMSEFAHLAIEAAERFTPMAEGKSIDIRVEPPPAADGCRVLSIDRRLVRGIALNLMSNAVKFTPAGGHVGLEFVAMDRDVGLRVFDDGPGIPPDLLPNVTRPYLQGDSSYGRRHGGLGLGLALVDAYARLQGGKLRIDSGPSGTSVTVVFPLRSARR